MLGLGSSLYKAGKVGKSIIRDGLVLKHGYNAGAVEPVSSGAAAFDASSDNFVDVGTIPITDNDVSLSAWVNIPSWVNYAAIITNRGGDDNQGLQIRIADGSQKFELFIDEGASGTTKNLPSSTLNSNQWYHVCGVFDRDGFMSLYINGVLDGTPVNISATADSLTHSTSVKIGKTGSTGIDGYICNVGYWNRVLDQDDVKSIMHKDYAALSASEKTGLVSWWNLDSVIDSVGAPTAVYDNHYGGGSELGAEMINNGSFDENDTGWDVDSNGDGTTKTWVNSFGGREGVLLVDIQGINSTNNRLKQDIDYISGAWYKVQADIYVVSGVVRIDGIDEDMLGGASGDVITTSGTGSWVTYTAYGYTPIATSSNTDSLFIRALHGSTAEFYIDNISVKKVNGNTGTLS